MIFDIHTTKDGKTVFEEVILGDAWDAAYLMTEPNFYVGCWSDYENCIVFFND